MHITTTDLGHSFDGEHNLFAGLTTTLRGGDMVALIGPSGSGKSTLLGIIAGWISPSTGTIEHEGINSTSWVFQNPHGSARRTALDHVVLPLLARGYRRRDAEEIALDTLAGFGLAHRAQHQFSHLSGGEAQRLMLARASIVPPDLLLVDEPTAQLDRTLARSVNDVLDQITAQDSIVVIATHDEDTAAACSRVINLGDYVPHGSGGVESVQVSTAAVPAVSTPAALAFDLPSADTPLRAVPPMPTIASPDGGDTP